MFFNAGTSGDFYKKEEKKKIIHFILVCQRPIFKIVVYSHRFTVTGLHRLRLDTRSVTVTQAQDSHSHTPRVTGGKSIYLHEITVSFMGVSREGGGDV